MSGNDIKESSLNSSFKEAISDDSDQGDETIVRLKKELSQVSFCELEELKHRVGSKRYNEAVNGHNERKQHSNKRCKADNKNRPIEMSSKKPAPRLRHVIPVKKKLSRDPRFDELSGHFNQDMFEKAFAFLDDIKASEKKQLLREMKKTKEPERKKELDSLLKRMEQQEAAKKSSAAKKQAEKERKKAELELVKQGKRPFYLKRSEKRKIELAEKFKQLKSSGKLEQYLKKRGKKNVSKERKKMPIRRGVDT